VIVLNNAAHYVDGNELKVMKTFSWKLTPKAENEPDIIFSVKKKTKTKLRDLSPRASYTDRATAACQRS
jgi:hypothetical protein